MRSRTELVTTTFIDSEDDFTETDDSEEDWRPSASTRNVKKRTHSTKGRNRGNRKRKSSSNSSQKNPKRQAAQDANYQTFDDSDDEDDDDYEYYKARTQLAAEVEPKAIILPPKKKERNLNGNSGVFQLYLYRKDLKEDYMINPHLCLWRKDGTNLLQKYIRVRTGVPEEFIFTSSSVYSTWDEKRRRDFINISVKCLEENNRRVTFVNTNDLHSLAKTELERVSSCLEQVHHAEEENDVEADEADADGSEHNSIGSECDDNDDSYRPDEEDAEGEGEGDADDDNDNDIENENEHENENDNDNDNDNDNIDEVEEEIEEEHASDDDPDEEEFEEFGQIEEEDEDDDNSEEFDDNINENEAEHN